MIADHDDSPRPFDKHIPKLFFLFFLVVFIANGALITSAFNSWTGLVEDNHYEKGRHFNEELALKKQLIEGDLVPRVGLETGGTALTLKLEFTRMPDAVSARLVRPIGELEAIAFPLKARSATELAATIDRPQPGQWDLEVVIEDGGSRYETLTRHFVPQN